MAELAQRRNQAASTSDSELAAEVKAHVAAGDMATARDRFGVLVTRAQRRACRIAYQYLRDASDADEAVQDAFVKVFTHILEFREDQPFDVWFTRILVNRCLDLLKARQRRQRRFVAPNVDDETEHRLERPATGPTPEEALIIRERQALVAAAVNRLPDRQRMVMMLCHFDERTPREVSQMTGMSESTVRVHSFRALRKLRTLLEGGHGRL